jgi:hypothetical protein
MPEPTPPLPFWCRARALYVPFALCRMSLLVVLLGAFMLLIPQAHDMTARLQDDVPRTLGYLVAVGLDALQVWFWARLLLNSKYRRIDRDPIALGAPLDTREALPKDAALRGLVDWLPRVLGFLAFATSWVALWLTSRDTSMSRLLLIGSGAVAVLFALFVIYREQVTRWSTRRFPRALRADRPDLWYLKRLFVPLSLIQIVGLTVWAVTAPVSMGFLLGAGVVYFLGLASIVPPISALTYLARNNCWPIVTTLIVIFLLAGLHNDNHTVRHLSDSAASRPSLAQAYAAWRSQAPRLHNRPVLILVATAGGGIRAAYWTANLLGTLEAQYPGFPHALFAVSGVSGGSLGAADYVADLRERQTGCLTVAAEEPQDPDCTQAGTPARLANALQRDFLGPVLAGGLFGDLMQQFIPLPAFPDRARALELSWERGWELSRPQAHTQGLSSPFASLWSADSLSKNWLPLLFFNGTRQENGQRIITASVPVTRAAFFDASDYFEMDNKQDVPLSTAVHNSARFSYVSPAGTIPDGGGERRRILDGGYFENFGATTAQELLAALDQLPDADFTLAVIQIASDPSLQFDANPNPNTSSIRQGTATVTGNEVLAPLIGLMQTRDSRGYWAAGTLGRWVLDRCHRTENSCVGPGYFRFTMQSDKRHTEPPLGWSLSSESEHVIEEMSTQSPNKEPLQALIAALSTR